MEIMQFFAEETIELMMFLASGLIVVGTFRSLTPYPPPSLFSQVAQALIFTIIVQIICWLIVELFEISVSEDDASWTTQYPPYLSFPPAIILGVFLAATYGNDLIHKVMRLLRITRETSFHSEWYSTFHLIKDCYVILHLSEERLIIGWPDEWPSQCENGHFRLSEYNWLKRGEADGELTLPSTHKNLCKASILIPVSEVVIVEFMRISSEDK